MSVITDLISANSLTRTSSGFSSERSFLVDNVPGTPEARLYNAVSTAGIPQINDPHPVLPDVIVTNVSAKPTTDPSQIIVTVSYSIPEVDEESIIEAEEDVPGSYSLTLASNTAVELTWFDINGNLLEATWGGGWKRTYKSVEVQRPQLTAIFNRIQLEPPSASQLLFIGKVNAVTWSGYPPKTWLCTAVNSEQVKSGKHNVEYIFVYKYDNWRVEIYSNLTGEEIAEIPYDRDSGNGYAKYDVYPSANFNNLGLSF